MRTVLVVAYLFPPLGGPGVQRVLSFVRHLPARGFRPVVVAAEDEGAYWARDESLLERVPAEAAVHRVKEGAPGRAARLLRRAVPRDLRSAFDGAFFVPDRQAPWLLPAARAALEAARRAPPDVIFASGAPWTNLLVGALVARRLGRPLVTDFRDPWTDGSVFAPVTPAHRALHRALERRVHRAATRIVANTRINAEELAASFPEAAPKTVTIPNGWDEDDFADLPLASLAGPLRVGYAGSFYAGRPVEDVLLLFARARALRPELTGLELAFAGPTGAGVSARRLGVEGVVDRGYLPLRAALEHLAESNLTLVTVPPDARPGWVPQKLYQQLRLGRPVLTIAPPGEAADIARAAGQPVVDAAAPDADARLGAVLVDALEARIPAPAPEVVARYDRRRLAAQLADVLEAACGMAVGRGASMPS